MKYPDNKFLILIVLALLAGLIIGWIDTRPNWNDTGVTVGLIFISSFVLGLFSGKNAWILALIIGLCITSLNFLVSSRLDSAISLVISLAGVYGGFALKHLIRA
jgi:hypothetical protein